VGLRDFAGDGESKAGSSSMAVPSTVDAGEAVEDPVPLFWWNTRAIVIDIDYGVAGVLAESNEHISLGVSGGIIGEVADGSGE
jgi:hypothetical protein